MKIKVLDKKCMLTKGYAKDAGLDLRAREGKIIKYLEVANFKTGICVEIPLGRSGDVRPRSGLNKQGIIVAYGTVDPGYTGEIEVTIINLSGSDFEIKEHERIAQLVICKIDEEIDLEIVEELPASERGNRGFGSTGIK